MAKRRRRPRAPHPKHLALTFAAGILAASALAGCDSQPPSAKAPICAPRATAGRTTAPPSAAIPTITPSRRDTRSSPMPRAAAGSPARSPPRAATMARPAPLPDRPRGTRARDLTDHLLLHWAQQSAAGEESVAATEPLWIAPSLHRELSRTGAALDHLLRR